MTRAMTTTANGYIVFTICRALLLVIYTRYNSFYPHNRSMKQAYYSYPHFTDEKMRQRG